MDRLIEKLRELAEKIIPLMIVGLIGWGGWNLYKKGTFKHGVGPAAASIVGKIPYFGTRFRHYLTSSPSKSYVAKGENKRRKGRAHHRKHRRHR